MFKFSKLSWCTFIAFGLALVCIMFNTLLDAMIYPALALLIVGFVLLSINLFIKANKDIKRNEMLQQELVIELSVTDEGEEYVVNDKAQKKLKKSLKKDKISKLMPAIMSVVMALLMVFLLFKFIFKF